MIRFKEKKVSDEKFNIKKIEEYLGKRDKFDEETLNIIKNISDLEKEYDSFKGVLKKLKREELDRLCKEFLVNDYERRFNVNQTSIISAIAGEENVNKELFRQNKEERVICFYIITNFFRITLKKLRSVNILIIFRIILTAEKLLIFS